MVLKNLRESFLARRSYLTRDICLCSYKQSILSRTIYSFQTVNTQPENFRSSLTLTWKKIRKICGLNKYMGSVLEDI